uniref:ORF-120 n=1 Tax=Buzura suppressaria nuclear polyhedrosis virus TaxID=74320 RepID=A0A0N7CSW1_NPVBS|nr:ORF-120 [Buzura suppressaria nucleopolyhedrovirus]
MDALRAQLFNAKNIPYISKKNVNDAIGKHVLSQLDHAFYAGIYQDVLNTVGQRHLCVLKGGAAIEAHLTNSYPRLNDVDIKVWLDDDNLDTVPILELKNAVEERVRRGSLLHQIQNVCDTTDLTMFTQTYYTVDPKNIIMFKSYTNEAVQFSAPHNVYLTVNNAMPIKMTMSRVDDSILVRYSFNVLAKSTHSMWLYRDSTCRRLEFFPFDFYFLDLSLQTKPADNRNYVYLEMFNTKAIVDDMENVVIEQLECVLFNIFYFSWDKIDIRIKRLVKLIEMLRNKMVQDEVKEKRRAIAYEHMKTCNYTIKDVKHILEKLGPFLGARLIIQLYFNKRFCNNIKDITHQVNFPYHRWDVKYFSKCWKQYCVILNMLFNLNVSIKL